MVAQRTCFFGPCSLSYTFFLVANTELLVLVANTELLVLDTIQGLFSMILMQLIVNILLLWLKKKSHSLEVLRELNVI